MFYFREMGLRVETSILLRNMTLLFVRSGHSLVTVDNFTICKELNLSWYDT